MSVMRGQCDARPSVTFPAPRHHHWYQIILLGDRDTSSTGNVDSLTMRDCRMTVTSGIIKHIISSELFINQLSVPGTRNNLFVLIKRSNNELSIILFC